MSILYKPVLIESVEQAEKLPIGTVAMLWNGRRLRDHAQRINDPVGPWEKDFRGYRHEAVIGWTALVPVEAEEETRIDRPGMRGINPVRRLVTPWESA